LQQVQAYARTIRGLLFEDETDFGTFNDPYEAAAGADALVLMTEWKLYWAPDFDSLRKSMSQAVIVDGRNIWSPEVVRRRGITYYAIGRITYYAIGRP